MQLRCLAACLQQQYRCWSVQAPGRACTLHAQASLPVDPGPTPLCLPATFVTRSAPGVGVVQLSVTDVAANVSLTPPSAAPAGGWAKYQLRACPATGCSSVAWVDCTPVRADGSATLCALSGLLSNTAYTVEAVAVKDAALRSQAGSAALTTRIS